MMDEELGIMKDQPLMMDAFMGKMLEVYPQAELGQDNDMQLVIYTGWYQDPDENEYIYLKDDEDDRVEESAH